MSKIKDRFSYQGEKLSQARSSLMVPHAAGEDTSFACAFEFCSRAFHQFDVERVSNEDVRSWINTINDTLNTDDVDDRTGEGTFLHRARALSEHEKRAFSRAVDELASWFNMEFWSND